MKTAETSIDLKVLVTKLLNPKLDEDKAKCIIDEIHKCFKEITLISGYNSNIHHMVTLPASKGMALSINHAAQCLLDYRRTVKILRGLVKAIRDKQTKHP
mgnify:CR=1 FL=1